MRPALVQGSAVTVERERAPKLELGSPQYLSTTSPSATHTASCDERQAKNTKCVTSTAAASRPYSNDGHVAQVIAGVHALARLRHGRQRVPVEEARDMYKALAMLEARATALNPRFVPDLHAWSGRRLCLSEAAKAEIRGEVADEGNDAGPVNVGYLLHVTDAERTKLKLWRVEAVDVTEADKVEKAKAADRERKQAGLRAKGIPPRGAEFARLSALYPGKGKTAIYDMIAKARATR